MPQVNVLALVDGFDEPFLYKQVQFKTLPRGGLNGWAVAAIVLGFLLACVLCTVAGLVIRRRRQLQSGGLLDDDGAVDMQNFEAGGLGALVASPLHAVAIQGDAGGGEGAGVVPLVAPPPPAGNAPLPPSPGDEGDGDDGAAGAVRGAGSAQRYAALEEPQDDDGEDEDLVPEQHPPDDGVAAVATPGDADAAVQGDDQKLLAHRGD